MKNIYINSHLHPLVVGVLGKGRHWIFSGGDRWLLLTPGRLARLASMLGRSDWRICRLVALVRRHAAQPEAFCRRLGLAESFFIDPASYAPMVCPRCDGVYFAHPDEEGTVCDDCRAKEREAALGRPGDRELREREADKSARERLLAKDSSIFYQGELSPNYKLNLHRRLERDWDKATRRILMGGTYRAVAKEFNCSVGLLHRKVKERFWENN